MTKIRTILADDHQLILDGLLSLLKDTEVEVIAQANDGAQLVELCQLLKPQLVLTDMDMPKLNGHDAIIQLRKEFPELKILVLTMHQDKGLYLRMMQAGANGFLNKNIDKEELHFAIHKIMNGKEYSSVNFLSETNRTDQNGTTNVPDLTKRELEIIVLIAEGHTNNSIGEKLFISERTVDTHRTNLMRKLGVNNVAGIIRYAYSNKLVQ
jgi:DNA-binding NarL/FixJ family response regulator